MKPKLAELGVNAPARELIELIVAVPKEASRRWSSPNRPEALLKTFPEVSADLSEEERDRGEDQRRCSAYRQLNALGYYRGQE